MDPDILRLAQLFAVIGMFTGGMIGIAWVTKLAFRPPRKQAPPLAPGVDEERFARLEQAVETIGLEVERIGEAQRFTTKLLAGRGVDPAIQPPAERAQRVTTPQP